jgi:hypothetical protein
LQVAVVLLVILAAEAVLAVYAQQLLNHLQVVLDTQQLLERVVLVQVLESQVLVLIVRLIHYLHQAVDKEILGQT